MTAIKKTGLGDGKKVLLCFLAFFGTVAMVDAAFVYTALRTYSGVVTKQAYEKGLSYNETLEKARAQPVLRDRMTYDDGALRWSATDESGMPILGAKARVNFFRPVKGGYDFEAVMTEEAAGTYTISPDLPVKGLWRAQLDVEWDNKHYQTTLDFIAK